MPGAPAIDKAKAALAINMDEAGYSGAEISRCTGISAQSVSGILARHGHWGEIDALPIFVKNRRAQQLHLEAAFRTAAAQFLARAMDEEKLQKASTYQLVIASSIAVDKSQLLAGLPTEIHASISITASLDQLAEKLSRALMPDPSPNNLRNITPTTEEK